MSPTYIKAIYIGLFLLFIFLSGFWLNRNGIPYSTAILTIHKLIALASGVFLMATLYRIHQGRPLSAMVLIAGLVTGLLYIGTVISGGLLSTGQPMPGVISNLYLMSPFMVLLSNTILLYFLLRKSG
jgi:hypothetical protein